MTTGSFWDDSDPLKPVGLMDPEAVMDIPYDWSEFCTGMSVTVASHTFDKVDAPLVVQSSSQVNLDTKVLARVATDPLVYDEDTHMGDTFGVTCHVIFSDGQQEDKTLYFKLTKK